MTNSLELLVGLLADLQKPANNSCLIASKLLYSLTALLQKLLQRVLLLRGELLNGTFEVMPHLHNHLFFQLGVFVLAAARHQLRVALSVFLMLGEEGVACLHHVLPHEFQALLLNGLSGCQ